MYYYNQNNYSNVKYDRPSTSVVETVASSGCGPVAMCIAINNLVGKEMFTVSQMAKISLDNGARDNSGTNLNTLIKVICSKYKGFSYSTTNDENVLVSHLKNGGIAISNQGDAYNVFSTAGHYVIDYRMSGKNIEIIDPQMYAGKYDAYSRPKRIVKKTTNGCIVSVSELAKATSDRNPAHFLISYDKPEEKKSEVKLKAPVFKEGEAYKLTTNLNVRAGAGTSHKQKKRSELTADGKKHALDGELAVLKKGTKVTAQKVVKNGNDIWLKIPSGYIAAYYKGDTFVK